MNALKAPLYIIIFLAVSLGVGIANSVGSPAAAAFIVGLGAALVTLVVSRGKS